MIEVYLSRIRFLSSLPTLVFSNASTKSTSSGIAYLEMIPLSTYVFGSDQDCYYAHRAVQ